MMYYEKSQPGYTAELIAQRDKDTHNKNYDLTGVRDQLYEDFNGICYICGYSNPSNAIEHLRPHRTVDRVKMFDWNNLFYACEHCNGIKSDSYTGLLDCTQIKRIDSKFEFKFDPSKPRRRRAIITDNGSTSPDTCELLQLVFSIETTPKRKMGAQTLERKLATELRNFDLFVDAWKKDPTPVNEELIKEQVNNTTDFAAFKRWKVRLDTAKYPTVIQSWFVD
ncbi:HNH endonuclease [Vibrio alginolyticus]|uniref:HNH endonuclease n=1 Tax=Vibrio alginolyticus TaxID=663 RepID=UPI00031C6042|nr:HNH endonuclease [Vibrio alginolyticus]ELA9729604.1 HNH endonuclease [Vibrio alginolyticus]ELB2903512.1 HNH endonuclease [Vibrio alginolyticus]